MFSDVLAIEFLSLALSLGCLTLVLRPAILVNLVDKKDIGKVRMVSNLQRSLFILEAV